MHVLHRARDLGRDTDSTRLVRCIVPLCSAQMPPGSRERCLFHHGQWAKGRQA